MFWFVRPALFPMATALLDCEIAPALFPMATLFIPPPVFPAYVPNVTFCDPTAHVFVSQYI